MPIPSLRGLSLQLSSPFQRALWQSLGFTLESLESCGGRNGITRIRFSNLELELLPPLRKPPTTITSDDDERQSGQPSVVSWHWDGVDSDAISNTSTFSVLPMKPMETGATAPTSLPTHPNQVTRVDHVVITTNNADKLVEDFKVVGIDLVRVRTDIYPGVTQMFFRTGAVQTHKGAFIELLSTSKANSAQPASSSSEVPEFEVNVWGIGLESVDLETTHKVVSPMTSSIRPAKQEGKKILTLKPTNALGVALAVLSRRSSRQQNASSSL